MAEFTDEEQLDKLYSFLTNIDAEVLDEEADEREWVSIVPLDEKSLKALFYDSSYNAISNEYPATFKITIELLSNESKVNG